MVSFLCVVIFELKQLNRNDAMPQRRPSFSFYRPRWVSLTGLADVGIAFLPMTEAAAVESAECWRIYRKQSGKSGRIVADFLIGGHAITQCDRLLTRDRGFYRDYFKKLSLLT